jgi:hypothetical protein
MSTGVMVYFPPLDRIFIPFISDENEAIHTVIQHRIKMSKEDPTKDINWPGLATIIHQFLNVIRSETKTETDSGLHFMFAGRMHHLLAKPQAVPREVYQADLITLSRALKKRDVKAPGIDQVVARLLSMMTFEDNLSTPDYFALWADEFSSAVDGIKAAEEK